jgi:hypothetical protein
MADQLQLRGGSTAQTAAFTGALREVTVDTDKKTIVVHDGSTVGGNPLLRQDLSNLPAGTIDNNDINASAAIVDTKLATILTAGKVSNSATTATNANTASAIVARDGSGNFTAGTITAALTGAASSNVLKAGDTMTGSLTVPSLNGGQLAGSRNRIINGDMRIDQRNAGASFTPTDSSYSLDRWKFRVSQTSKLTVQQNAGAVTPPAGFSNYLGVTSSSAYAVTSTDYFVLVQDIEGYNFSDFDFGTANAKTLTISFWVRSSITGTFNATIRNGASNRSYPVTYTISIANTWEQKIITVAGDTSGTWVGATNGTGLSVIFNLGCGSTFNGTSGSWQAGNYTSVSGATSVVGTNGATFYITGVQLEPGTVATPFERRSYGAELALCQRYYIKSEQFITALCPYTPTSSTADLFADVQLPVTMRSVPTITLGTQTPGGGAASLQTKDGFRYGSIVGAANTAYSVSGFNASIEL